MSFLHRLSSLFGLGDDTEDTDIDLTSDDPEESVPEVSKPRQDVAEAAQPAGIDPEMKGRIFEDVLTVFNAALPDFLQRSIDPAAQRRAMAESIDRSLDRYLDAVGAEAERRAEARMQASITRTKEDSEKLQARIHELEKLNEKSTDTRLSAERRYRALSDRVADLEQQLADSEAEREQLDLEKRSLMNKIKVSEVQGNAAPDELVQELEQLRRRVSDFEKSSELNKGIYDDLQSQLKEAQERAEALAAELEEEKSGSTDLAAELETEKARAAELAAQLDKEKARTADLAARVDDNAGLAEELSQLQENVAKVEDVIARKDEKITRLKAANKKLRDDLANANGEIEMLRRAEGTSLFAASADNPEDDFECPDWFVSEPDATAAIPRPQMPEFGYQEPPKKPKAPENDAQLSLFE